MSNGTTGLWRLRFRHCGRVSILGASVVTVGCVCAVTAAFANTPRPIARSAAASRECTKIVDAKDIRRRGGDSVKAPVVSSDTVVLGSDHASHRIGSECSFYPTNSAVWPKSRVFFTVTIQNRVSRDQYDHLHSHFSPGADEIQFPLLAKLDHEFSLARATTPRGVLSTAWVLDGSKLFSVSSDEDTDLTVGVMAYTIYLNIEHHRA
jgi:hypothetical protein